MAHMRGHNLLFVGGVLLLVSAVPAVNAQTLPTGFEVAAGVQYGIQDPENPVTPGWVVSSGFDLGGTVFVVEGAWHRDTHVQESYWEFGEVSRETSRSRYWMLMGGVRGGERGGRVAPFYQVLAGGFAARFRVDYEWPESLDVEAANANCGFYDGDELIAPCLNVPYPEFYEERNAGFVMQPGMGLDVNVWREFTLRLAADLPIFASPDYVVLRPRLSARVVVGFGH